MKPFAFTQAMARQGQTDGFQVGVKNARKFVLLDSLLSGISLAVLVEGVA